MPRAYRQLGLAERRTIFRLLDANVPVAAVARELGRHRSTIHREIGRNHFCEPRAYAGYFPLTAHDQARQRRRRLKKLSQDEGLRRYILDKLEHWWSPEQIAGRLKQAGAERRLCHETIYQFVYGPEGQALELHRHLLRARRQRRRRFGRKPRPVKIPLDRTIAHRPGEIGRRHEIGHWEADLLIFRQMHGKANLTALVERKSRLLVLVPNSDRRSRGVIGAIGSTLAILPPATRRTITFDRGSEFLGYGHLAINHGIDAYFCDPHSPWQKGSIENANGRLRRFLPGQLDPTTLTSADIRAIETRMNTTPRKCLSFMTPQEAFAGAAAAAG